MNAARYHIGKPTRVWKHMPKRYKASYTDNDSVKVIIHLHKIEARLRAEIEAEQVFHWSPEQIRARFG